MLSTCHPSKLCVVGVRLFPLPFPLVAATRLPHGLRGPIRIPRLNGRRTGMRTCSFRWDIALFLIVVQRRRSNRVGVSRFLVQRLLLLLFVTGTIGGQTAVAQFTNQRQSATVHVDYDGEACGKARDVRRTKGLVWALVLCLAVSTQSLGNRWKDSRTLWKSAIASDESNALAYSNFRLSLEREGAPRGEEAMAPI